MLREGLLIEFKNKLFFYFFNHIVVHARWKPYSGIPASTQLFTFDTAHADRAAPPCGMAG